MAIRSTTNKGVVVALVVFIIISAALLATTIIFYSKLGKETEDRTQAEQKLSDLATVSERGSDEYQAIEGASGRESVFGYLNQQHQDLMNYVGRDMELEELKKSFQDSLDVDPNTTLWSHLNKMDRQLREDKDTIAALMTESNRFRSRRKTCPASFRPRSGNATSRFKPQSTVSWTRFAKRTRTTNSRSPALDGLEKAKERNRGRYVDQIRDLEDEVDRLSDENVRGESRIQELQELVNRSRIQPKDPANLVDGEIIEVAGRGDQVYIDRGKSDQIVLGMTFEVYDDAAQIRPDDEGNFPRGKASIQVVKVGDTTSTAKVTRATKGRPIVSNDVVANAIYDPTYTFKFLVHGRFDVDGDEIATLEETDYLRRQIEAWGGEVVSGDQITGDLDFLVLGIEPVNPPNPTDSATATQMQQILEQRLKYQYQDLFELHRSRIFPFSIRTGSTS